MAIVNSSLPGLLYAILYLILWVHLTTDALKIDRLNKSY